jgi:hypothetical protein
MGAVCVCAGGGQNMPLTVLPAPLPPGFKKLSTLLFIGISHSIQICCSEVGTLKLSLCFSEKFLCSVVVAKRTQRKFQIS